MPVTYSKEIADRICEKLASGESLRAICREPGFPTETAVRLWASEDRHGFAAQYARARDIGLDVVADEVMAIADDGSADTVTRYDAKGNPYTTVDQEHINRSRLRFDARRWYLSKLAPKRYGDRIQQVVTDADGQPLKLEIVHIHGKDEKPEK